MWLEAVFSREDLQSLVSELVPLTIRLGHDGEHYIELTDAHDISLVAAIGLRVSCHAVVHWPVVGVHVPVHIEPLTAILKPVVTRTEQGDTLAFKLEIEHADFTGIPSLVDRGITGTLNDELSKRHVELSWNFATALSRVIELPSTLQPVDGLDLRVRWGKVRVTEEAMVMAVSFHPTVLRHGEHAAVPRSAALVRGNQALVRRHGARLPKPAVVAAWASFALAILLGMRAAKHAWA